MEEKYLILPCSGIGKALGTITRWAAYELVENILPNQTRLLCLARLTVKDEESQEIVKKYPSITIDGCPKACSSKNVCANEGKVVKSYMMSKFLIKHKDLKIESKNVIDPGENALELAKRIANEIKEDILNKNFDTIKEGA